MKLFSSHILAAMWNISAGHGTNCNEKWCRDYHSTKGIFNHTDGSLIMERVFQYQEEKEENALKHTAIGHKIRIQLIFHWPYD